MHKLVLSNLGLLTTLYTSTGRFYHDLHHIHRMIGDLEMAKHLPEFAALTEMHWNALEIAIWFHDAIYNTQAQQITKGYSEIASAQLLSAMAAKEGGCSLPEILLAMQLVTVTAAHGDDLSTIESDPNCLEELATRLMLDLDLAELGYSYEVFKWNTGDVRAEYYNKPETNALAVVKGNGAFLAHLTTKSRIFYTNYFRELYEDQTRHNIMRLLEEDREEIERLERY